MSEIIIRTSKYAQIGNIILQILVLAGSITEQMQVQNGKKKDINNGKSQEDE